MVTRKSDLPAEFGPDQPHLTVDTGVGTRASHSEVPAEGWPEGAPEREFLRSPAAFRVGQLAAESGLFLFHRAYRRELPLADGWLPAERPDLGDPPAWKVGVIQEPKYQGFRHDLLLGSYHPGHRAKWATHELLHGLVGFAWRPGASPLYHALAARLAELLPVALWYFFDEVRLRRCPVHEGGGALFDAFCAQCEEVASQRPLQASDQQRAQDGIRFFDRELIAIRRSVATGRSVPHRWATLELASDALAYASAHARRLDSLSMRRWVAEFAVAGGGWHRELADLEERVIRAAAALVGGASLEPLAPSRAHGRWRWVLQDVGARLCQLWEETGGEEGGEAAEAIDRMIITLSRAIPATQQIEADVAGEALQALQAVSAGWRELYQEFHVPEPHQLWALGYAIPGLEEDTRSSRWLLEGLSSVSPLSLRALGPQLSAVVRRFAREDRPARTPLCVRWSSWLGRQSGVPPEVLPLARYEAALATVPTPDLESVSLGPAGEGGLRLSPGARLHSFGCDVVRLAEQTEAGVAGVPEGHAHLLMMRDPGGDVMLLDISPEAAEAIQQQQEGEPLSGIPAQEAASLAALGALVPVSWEVV